MGTNSAVRWLVIISVLLWTTAATAATNGQNWQFSSATFDATTFVNLPTETDGTLRWCSNCTKTTTCAGGGTGAFAFGQQGIWSCAATAGSGVVTMGGDVTGPSNAAVVSFAGGGAGNFEAGSLGVFATPDGVLGDALFSGGVGVGFTSSASSAGAGNVVIDNAFTCNNAAVATGVNCLSANNGTSLFSLISITAAGAFQFGSSSGTGPAINFVTSSINSMTFAAGGPTLMSIATGTVTIPNNSGTALKLINGAVLTMTGGTLPTLTACNGAGSSVTATSTPNRGQFATQTAGCSTATVHFSQTMPQKMFCVCGDGNATITPVACSYDYPSSSTTQAVFDFANAGASYKYDYVCF